jgi:Domain of unknown function (DUF4259)
VVAEAVAAADIVAAMMGRPSGDWPEVLTKRLDAIGTPAPALIKLTQKSVSRVLMESELVDLWAKSDEVETWNLSVTDLIARLDASGAGGQSNKKAKSDGINAVCPFCQETIGSVDAVDCQCPRRPDQPVLVLSSGLPQRETASQSGRAKLESRSGRPEVSAHGGRYSRPEKRLIAGAGRPNPNVTVTIGIIIR